MVRTLRVSGTACARRWRGARRSRWRRSCSAPGAADESAFRAVPDAKSPGEAFGAVNAVPEGELVARWTTPHSGPHPPGALRRSTRRWRSATGPVEAIDSGEFPRYAGASEMVYFPSGPCAWRPGVRGPRSSIGPGPGPRPKISDPAPKAETSSDHGRRTVRPVRPAAAGRRRETAVPPSARAPADRAAHRARQRARDRLPGPPMVTRGRRWFGFTTRRARVRAGRPLSGDDESARYFIRPAAARKAQYSLGATSSGSQRGRTSPWPRCPRIRGR
jgi:hypothetical protein